MENRWHVRWLVLFSLLSLLHTARAEEPAAPSWRTIGPGAYGAMWGIAFHPTDPKTLIAGLDMGIAAITHDGGQTWATLGAMGQTPMGQPAYRGGWGVAFDPRHPQNIWIASEHGVSKSEDGGKTWRLRFGGPPTCYDAIAIDPQDTSIVYIGEGRSVRLGVPWTTGFIHKTVDGGNTWTLQRPGGPLEKDPVRARNWSRLCIDPQSPFVPGKGHQRIYAAGQGGLYVSNDAGDTWTCLEETMPGGLVDLARTGDFGGPKVRTSGICDLAVVPGPMQATLFATFQVVPVTGDKKTWRGGVYRSDDGGATWTEKNSGLEPVLAYMATDDFHRNQGLAFGYAMIAAAPTDPKTLYFGCYNGVYKSVDQGEHWVLMTHPNDEWRKITAPDGKMMYAHVRRPGGNYKNASWGSLAAFNGLTISPANADVVAYTDNNGVGLSTDGGGHWDEPIFEFGEAYQPADRFPGTIAMRLTHRTRAHGVQLVVPDALALDPFDPNTLAVAYDDIGLEISRDSGRWWEWAWDGMYPNNEQNQMHAVVYDPQVKNRLYAGSGRGGTAKVYQSDDGGRTFHVIGIPQLAQTPGAYTVNDIVLDPASPANAGVIYVSTNKGIFKTSDGGTTWEDSSTGLGAGINIKRLEMDPKNSQRLYAGADPYGAATPDSGLYRSNDGGKHWQRLGADRLGGIRTISICRAQPEVLVVSAQPPGKMGTWAFPTLYRSQDGGATWTQLDQRRCCVAAVHPTNPNIIYMGLWAFDISKEPVGLFCSRDGGKTWTEIDQQVAYTIGFASNDRIIFDPKDARHFFLLSSTGVQEIPDPNVPR